MHEHGGVRALSIQRLKPTFEDIANDLLEPRFVNSFCIADHSPRVRHGPSGEQCNDTEVTAKAIGRLSGRTRPVGEPLPNE